MQTRAIINNSEIEHNVHTRLLQSHQELFTHGLTGLIQLMMDGNHQQTKLAEGDGRKRRLMMSAG